MNICSCRSYLFILLRGIYLVFTSWRAFIFLLVRIFPRFIFGSYLAEMRFSPRRLLQITRRIGIHWTRCAPPAAELPTYLEDGAFFCEILFSIYSRCRGWKGVRGLESAVRSDSIQEGLILKKVVGNHAILHGLKIDNHRVMWNWIKAEKYISFE